PGERSPWVLFAVLLVLRTHSGASGRPFDVALRRTIGGALVTCAVDHARGADARGGLHGALVSGGGFFPDGVDIAAAHVVVGVALSAGLDDPVLLQLPDGPADRVAVDVSAESADGFLLGPDQCI